ncbi:hypothetical protein BDP27DRAFT_303923 [Rhodocollybia butyracea]|uniref:Uncharacterized protein n=1 Tax=Rhodocollybia butyracea TaxID=206335 RepID=A0A9P5PEZ1_9AGAR|nr:hypothetical protein BDP27DRAFT_303923 [Rhodocollybia butyracea]
MSAMYKHLPPCNATRRSYDGHLKTMLWLCNNLERLVVFLYACPCSSTFFFYVTLEKRDAEVRYVLLFHWVEDMIYKRSMFLWDPVDSLLFFFLISTLVRNSSLDSLSHTHTLLYYECFVRNVIGASRYPMSTVPLLRKLIMVRIIIVNFSYSIIFRFLILSNTVKLSHRFAPIIMSSSEP